MPRSRRPGFLGIVDMWDPKSSRAGSGGPRRAWGGSPRDHRGTIAGSSRVVPFTGAGSFHRVGDRLVDAHGGPFRPIPLDVLRRHRAADAWPDALFEAVLHECGQPSP